MSEKNKAVLQRVYEIISQGNLADLREVVGADVVDHNPTPDQSPGLEGMIQTLTMWRTAFSDFRISVKDLIAEGDKVASRVVASGTNTGELMGMPPTGKQVSVSGMEMAHIKDGKVVERWGEFDTMSMMQQLGHARAPGEDAA